MYKKTLFKAALIWGAAVLFYLYQYVLRVSPGVMADDIMIAFQMDATGFGMLTAFATFCYAIMQIPMGVLVDVYGTRRLILASVLTCAMGVAVFAATENIIVAYLGRFLMGMGSACAFLSVSKVINEWFPDSTKGFMMGMTATAGTIGALVGGVPLAWLIEAYGWRSSLYALAVIGAAVYLLNMITLPKHSQKEQDIAPGEESAPFWEIGDVFRNRQIWIYALVAVGIYLCIAVIADLWGVPFAIRKFGLEKAEAAWLVSYIYIGVCVGCPFFGGLTRFFRSIRTPIIGGALGVTLSMAALVFIPSIPSPFVESLFFLIGFFAGAEILCFTGACALIGPEVAGTVTGFLNCIVTLFGAIIQSNIGMLLDYFWQGDFLENGMRFYTTYTYEMAFLVILILTTSSLIGGFFIKSLSYKKIEIS